jgi:hypothetical protein
MSTSKDPKSKMQKKEIKQEGLRKEEKEEERGNIEGKDRRIDEKSIVTGPP